VGAVLQCIGSDESGTASGIPAEHQGMKPEPLDNSRLMVTMSIGELRQVIAEEIQ